MDISAGDLRLVFWALGKKSLNFFIYSTKVIWNGGFMVVLHGHESVRFRVICSYVKLLWMVVSHTCCRCVHNVHRYVQAQ